MNRIVVVGPPCSGKTTTAAEIARRLSGRVVLRKELWSGNRESARNLRPVSFLRSAMRGHPKYNREVESLIGAPATAHLNVIRLRDDGAVRDWLERVGR